MKTPIVIAVILGTARPERRSIYAARYVADHGKTLDDVEIVFIDPLGFSFPGDGRDDGAADPAYSALIHKADAFFIVSPEYNHGIPGSLKRMLDSEYEAYYRKPVALAGVSNGPWGGVRVCEALLPVCHRLGMINIRPELYFPNIQDIFDTDGSMHTAQRERYDKNTQHCYDELLWFVRLLKNTEQ